MWELDYKQSWVLKNWCFWTAVLKTTLNWESLGLQGDPTILKVLNILWKDWCWSWSSSTLATWCEELTHWKRSWCWERLKAGGDGDDWGWDGWMASSIQWTWVWVNSGSWWWTGRPGVLWSIGLQSWTWLSNWNELNMTIGQILVEIIYQCIFLPQDFLYSKF